VGYISHQKRAVEMDGSVWKFCFVVKKTGTRFLNRERLDRPVECSQFHSVIMVGPISGRVSCRAQREKSGSFCEVGKDARGGKFVGDFSDYGGLFPSVLSDDFDRYGVLRFFYLEVAPIKNSGENFSAQILIKP
jgi:hypothetical protein